MELSVYNGIPHLLLPVVTDPKKAAGALHWGVNEMTERYKKFEDMHVRDLKGYNKKVEEMTENGGAELPQKLPQIVIIVDELADLMMVAPGEVEESICRLAQLARAAGIHLAIATQRPSVDVITGLIKANMPSRIAFAVSSGVDSRTILDMNIQSRISGEVSALYMTKRRLIWRIWRIRIACCRIWRQCSCIWARRCLTCLRLRVSSCRRSNFPGRFIST